MHQKRLSAPRDYPIRLKSGGKFVVVSSPGPHDKETSIPLLILIRDILKYAESAREAKKIINEGKVYVDGKVRKNYKYPVGIFDVIWIPDTKEIMRIVPGEKRLNVVKIPENEKNIKLCRIENKTIVKGGKTQLNLNDGKNLLVEKDSYKTGDSLVIEVPVLKINKHIKRDEGIICMIVKGKNKGRMGIIKKIKKTEGSQPNLVSVELSQRLIDLPESYVFVVGEKSPVIKISD
ncbi:MAG: 30S ribosomal protein S4e [Candidatus Aenigmarchaeota archaeon]|nr:30S ribosomal protein S4e [Candidatus Aenigmarchaeota archaeon]